MAEIFGVSGVPPRGGSKKWVFGGFFGSFLGGLFGVKFGGEIDEKLGRILRYPFYLFILVAISTKSAD